MDKEALYYMLEDYLDGRLSEKESATIRQLIANDEAVAEQFKLVKLEREMASVIGLMRH